MIASPAATLGTPRLHLGETASTSDRARALALAGAPHGTLVTARDQTAGRGRQGRGWSAPPGRALACSLVLRHPPALLPLAAAVAVAGVAGAGARVKWPNDVLLDGRKVAGVLVEGRPAEAWAVLGIGINVAVRPHDLPEDLRATAGSLGLEPGDVEAVLERLLAGLERALALPGAAVLAELRRRDALRGRTVAWAGGQGVAEGIADDGRLVVRRPGGTLLWLGSGEVHLAPPSRG